MYMLVGGRALTRLPLIHRVSLPGRISIPYKVITVQAMGWDWWQFSISEELVVYSAS